MIFLCRKNIPTSSKSSGRLSGLCQINTPRTSRQSAVPHCEDAARFPCLATFIPPAAATRADVVEILKLYYYHHQFLQFQSHSCFDLLACALSLAAAHPAISSVVSALALLVDKAARKAAFCVAVVSPLMISFITECLIVSEVFFIDDFYNGFFDHDSYLLYKISKHLLSIRCHYGFRMKLYPVDRIFFMLHCHYLSVRSESGTVRTFGNCRASSSLPDRERIMRSGVSSFYLINCHFIITDDFDIRIYFANELVVIRKAVAIIDK